MPQIATAKAVLVSTGLLPERELLCPGFRRCGIVAGFDEAGDKEGGIGCRIGVSGPGPVDDLDLSVGAEQVQGVQVGVGERAARNVLDRGGLPAREFVEVVSCPRIEVIGSVLGETSPGGQSRPLLRQGRRGDGHRAQAGCHRCDDVPHGSQVGRCWGEVDVVAGRVLEAEEKPAVGLGSPQQPRSDGGREERG